MKFLVLTLISISLFGCGATKYQNLAGSYTGGHDVKHMEGDIYRVVFSANGFTTRETAQTYWLYRCASLTLEKGYEGFQILSNITLTQKLPADVFFSSVNPSQKVQYYVPLYIDESNKPHIEADIKLLKGGFEASPPKIFNAEKLKLALEPYVKGEKCSEGNVCGHVHKYLFPGNSI